MKKLVLAVFTVLLSFSAVTGVFAQESAATIIFGEGYGFNLLRDGEESYYDILYDDVIGFKLKKGDYVSTDEETFLEIQLTSSSNVLKISENTSFQIAEVSGKGGGEFALTYGRVRAKVNRLLGDDEFNIGGPSAVAGVRGTDFGYDIVAKRTTTEQFGTVAQVYCFEGKVEVSKIKPKEISEPEGPVETAGEETKDVLDLGEMGGTDTVILEANQMVSFAAEEEGDPVKEEFVPREIEEEINVFWDRYDFTGEMIDYPEPEEVSKEAEKEPEKEEEKPVVEEEPEEEKEEIILVQEEKRKAKARKSFLIAGTTVVGIGALTEVAGILLNFFGAQWFGGDPNTYREVGTVLMITGGGVAFGGLLTYLGILVNK